MNRTVLTSVTLGAALFGAGTLFGQNKNAATGASTTPAAQQQKLVRVATIDGIEANREFQHNVQVVQAEREAAVQLNAKMEKETDAKKKADLKKQLDELMAKLNKDNETMAKTYGFSLTRNYAVVIEKSQIYMFVTNEEAAKLEQQAKEKAEKKK